MKESSNSKSFYNGDSCGRTSFKAMETLTISPFQVWLSRVGGTGD